MNLTSYFNDLDVLIPIEAIWESLDRSRRCKAYRMLKTGELLAEGRLLNTAINSPFDVPYGDRVRLSRETWEDASKHNWFDGYKPKQKLQLNNKYVEHIFVELRILNSRELRGLAEYEELIGSIEGFDKIFMKQMNGKIGTKVFAFAAAALASGEVNASAKALSEYLLGKTDLWPNGEISERNLEKHLAPFVSEFKKLTGLA